MPRARVSVISECCERRVQTAPRGTDTHLLESHVTFNALFLEIILYDYVILHASVRSRNVKYSLKHCTFLHHFVDYAKL